MSIKQREMFTGSDYPPDRSYASFQLERALEDYLSNYSHRIDDKIKKELPWHSIYVKQLRSDGEEEKAAEFVAIKFLVYVEESIDRQDGKAVYVPASPPFYQQVNDYLRFHLNEFTNERGFNGCDDIVPGIDWSNQDKYRQFTPGSTKLDRLVNVADLDGGGVTEVSCSYIFDQSSVIAGVLHQFNRLS
jgi:hypothetical protein